MATLRMLLVVVSALYSLAAADRLEEQPLTPVQGIAQSTALLSIGILQQWMTQRPLKSPPISTDPCVLQCTPMPSQMDPTITTTLLQTYCGSVQCLKAERSSDGQKSCLDAVLAPQLQGICDLDTDSTQQDCYAQIGKCQGIARETIMSLVSAEYVAAVIDVQTSHTTGLCSEYTCVQEMADKCTVPSADLAYMTQGVVYKLSQWKDNPIPESLYCCLPDLYRTSLGKCYPDAIDYIVENKNVLEAIVGASAVNALTDSARDFKRVMQEWGKEISSLDGAEHQQWVNGLIRVVERFQTAIEHENLSREDILRNLQDPDKIKPLLRMVCDINVNIHTCILQETRAEGNCDSLWPFIEKSFNQTTEQVAELKMQLKQQEQHHGGGSIDDQRQGLLFSILEMYLDECPMERTAAKIAEAA